MFQFNKFIAIAHAQTTGTVPPLPAGLEQGQTLATFLPWLFSAMLAAAVVLSIFAITYAGFQWMTGAISESQVSEAKKRIQSALIGLALAFSSYLILYTINPNLVKLKIPSTLTADGSWYCKSSPIGYATREACNLACYPEGGGLCSQTAPQSQFTDLGTLPPGLSCNSLGTGFVEAPPNLCLPPPIGNQKCCGRPAGVK